MADTVTVFAVSFDAVRYREPTTSSGFFVADEEPVVEAVPVAAPVRYVPPEKVGRYV